MVNRSDDIESKEAWLYRREALDDIPLGIHTDKGLSKEQIIAAYILIDGWTESGRKSIKDMKEPTVVHLEPLANFGVTEKDNIGTVIESLDHGVRLICDSTIDGFECYTDNGRFTIIAYRVRRFGSNILCMKMVHGRGMEGSGNYQSIENIDATIASFESAHDYYFRQTMAGDMMRARPDYVEPKICYLAI